MTANNPSMTVTPTNDTGSTPPSYRPHDMQQLGTGTNLVDFRSVGDYASSGNYAGGTGNSDEPIDRAQLQAQFNSQPYLRRPFGPQEMK